MEIGYGLEQVHAYTVKDAALLLVFNLCFKLKRYIIIKEEKSNSQRELY